MADELDRGPIGAIVDSMGEGAVASEHFVDDETMIIAIASNGDDMCVSTKNLPPMRSFKLLMAAAEIVMTEMNGRLSIVTLFGDDD